MEGRVDGGGRPLGRLLAPHLRTACSFASSLASSLASPRLPLNHLAAPHLASCSNAALRSQNSTPPARNGHRSCSRAKRMIALPAGADHHRCHPRAACPRRLLRTKVRASPATRDARSDEVGSGNGGVGPRECLSQCSPLPGASAVGGLRLQQLRPSAGRCTVSKMVCVTPRTTPRTTARAFDAPPATRHPRVPCGRCHFPQHSSCRPREA